MATRFPLSQENYVNMRPDQCRSNDERLALLARASDSISLGDISETLVRRWPTHFFVVDKIFGGVTTFFSSSSTFFVEGFHHLEPVT